MRIHARWMTIGVLAVGAACNLPAADAPAVPRTSPQAAGDAPAIPTATLVVPETIIPQATPTAALPATATPTAAPTLTPTPYGCQKPGGDYTLVTLPGDYQLNQRTVEMLEYAQTLYGGTHDLLKAITQGSYHRGVDASFGTHDGGGAVDLSLRDLLNWNHVLYEEADAIILALRRAGFAAWVRDVDALYAGSPVHIHAIAVGDADLSPAAQSQLTGPEGYFRGNNGLPDNIQPDPHGGPILCPWMIELGYQDLRGAP